jgi:hypothetical protein
MLNYDFLIAALFYLSLSSTNKGAPKYGSLRRRKPTEGRPVVSRGTGDAIAPLEFGNSINPIPTRALEKFKLIY